MEIISFLSSKGVVDISKDGGYETYSVYLNLYYIGSVLRKSEFQHHNEDKPVFNESERQVLVDIALGKMKPKSLIKPTSISVNGDRWTVKQKTKDMYEVKNAGEMTQGYIKQEMIEGRLMWVSDKIGNDILKQIAPQMLSITKTNY